MSSRFGRSWLLCGIVASVGACADTGSVGRDVVSPPADLGAQDVGAYDDSDAAQSAPDADPTGNDVVQPPPDVAPSSDGGPCVPTVSRGAEATNALCSDGLDNDCNGYIDCTDWYCSRYTPSVTVCRDAGPADAATTPDVAPPPDGSSVDQVGAHGGTVRRMQFAVFGDVRPANPEATSTYPTAVIRSIMSNIASLSPQFVVGTGDYMFTYGAQAMAQANLLLDAEQPVLARGAPIFHAMGNHECNEASNSNCPNGNETTMSQVFRSVLSTRAPGPAPQAAPWYDFVVHTGLGDAHFVVTAPNAWGAGQAAWLETALSQAARYTILVAHEPYGSREAPGTTFIEAAMMRHPGVALVLHGHTHTYYRAGANTVVSGNAGAPLASATSDFYGFLFVTQRDDGNLVVTAYEAASAPAAPMVRDSFVVTPAGAATR